MLKAKRIVSRDYRNRRIGDFLKELGLTEGRGTGIPKIHRELEKNGSPPPIFETDEQKTSFLAILPINPGFLEQGNATPNFRLKGIEQDEVMRTLLFCYTRRSRQAILERIGLANLYKNHKNHVVPLIQEGLLALSIPEKPNSPLQTYYTTQKGKDYLG
jgi:ATP-dependent DNA helicase RecG